MKSTFLIQRDCPPLFLLPLLAIVPMAMKFQISAIIWGYLYPFAMHSPDLKNKISQRKYKYSFMRFLFWLHSSMERLLTLEGTLEQGQTLAFILTPTLFLVIFQMIFQFPGLPWGSLLGALLGNFVVNRTLTDVNSTSNS